jgi:signal transduction histidine kinase
MARLWLAREGNELRELDNFNGIELELDADDHLVMRVLDNGRGVPAEFDTASGNGLRNMTDRARLLGGDCTVIARSERGTELRWWVPIPH